MALLQTTRIKHLLLPMKLFEGDWIHKLVECVGQCSCRRKKSQSFGAHVKRKNFRRIRHWERCPGDIVKAKIPGYVSVRLK